MTVVNPGGGAGAVASVFTRTGAVAAATADYSVAQVTGAAPLASPTLTGTPAAPTPAALDNSTKLATTAYGDAAVAVEKTRALAAEALLAPLASPTLTGTPAAPTPAALDNTTKLATTAYADAADAVEKTRALAAEALLAPLASPALTGHPTGVTESALTNNTRLASTGYADAAVSVANTRALAAEALLAPLASAALTGSPTAPTQAAGDSSTKLATTAFVTAPKQGAWVTKSGNYTMSATDGGVLVTAAATITLPATPTPGFRYGVKNAITAGGTVTVSNGANKIDNYSGGLAATSETITTLSAVQDYVLDPNGVDVLKV